MFETKLSPKILRLQSHYRWPWWIQAINALFSLPHELAHYLTARAFGMTNVRMGPFHVTIPNSKSYPIWQRQVVSLAPFICLTLFFWLYFPIIAAIEQMPPLWICFYLLVQLAGCGHDLRQVVKRTRTSNKPR